MGPVIADLAAGLSRKFRRAFQKAPDLLLRLEAARGETFHRLGHKGGRRFVLDQDFSLQLVLFKFEAHRRDKGVIARFQPGLGFLAGLTADLLAL